MMMMNGWCGWTWKKTTVKKQNKIITIYPATKRKKKTKMRVVFLCVY